ncbi:MAG: TonB-dependent receptor [Salegentibacter sp.]|uniref:SusC/RagA family TonB-linked outer membrane protein n=1 Tax=Salegentibacter sp. TaxID=1903072 RepID=UPI002870730D|nr:TonB-dependent receptor [Salegentibacter sp.]MDR9456820.1 TonB-dependent receptor [Salegentibacter sp.]
MKNYILILTLFCSLYGFAQDRQISGTVTDETGLTVPGASVLIKDTNRGTMTDFDGNFELTVNDGETLVISFIGYLTQEVPIDNRNTYNIVLQEDVSQLDEVIVTGYTAERKSDIAGAITVVDVSELSQEFSPNILTSLQGRVPGIQINSGGTPGGNDSQILIRGLTTVNSGSSPLWVIDGVQTFNPSSLNPDEIESIQVLKDGASAALYGTSAANGVIVVTTKKGKEGMSEFSVKSETTLNMLRDDIDVLNARQWADVYYQARTNDGISGNYNMLTDNGSGFDIPEFLDEEQLLRASDTDWVDVIIDNSFSYNTDANYRFGDENIQLFTGVNYTKDNGIQKYTYYDRFNARLNTTFKLWNDRITVGENFLYSNFNEVQANEFENAILQNPLLPVYTESGSYMAPVIQDKANSLANLWANRKNQQRNNRFLGNVYANFEILEGLNFNTSINFDYVRHNFDTRTQPFVQMNQIPSVFRNIDVDQVENEFFKTIFTNLLSYEFEYDKHRFNVLGGIEFTREDEDFLNERIRGVDITDYPNYIVRTDAEFQTLRGAIEYRKQSQFGSLKYIFDNRYIISGSIRRDGSSRFGPNNRFGIFPAASVAWNVSNEEFLIDSETISNLKFRGSWGVNGNDLIGNYLFLSAFLNNSVGNVIEFSDYDIVGDGYGTQNGILQARQANPDIQWEETTQYNVGFDVGFFMNRLSLSADFFDKRTNNLILQPIAQAITGESDPPTINAGEVSNIGFESVLSFQSKRDKNFTFGADLNFSHYKNNVESLDTDNNFLLNSAVAITQKGYPIASFYGLIADGIFRTPEEVAVHARQSGKDLGRIRYKDLNNDGVIDNNDRTIIGNPHPDFIYGLNLNAAYKGFDLSAYFDGKQGHDIYNTQRNLGDFTYFSFNFGQNTLDAWTPERANSNIPALSTNNSNNEIQPSSYFVEDGSYFRLKNITVGYTFSEDITGQLGLSNLRFYLSGQNLVDFTSFSGFDYEVSGLGAGGIGIAGYGIPHTKTVSFGVSTNF